MSNNRAQLRGENNDQARVLSPLEEMPTEIMRIIAASELETSQAVIRAQGGCLRFELNPAILQTSKTIFTKCVKPWRDNRPVRITYKGGPGFRPTAFVPVLGNDAYKILTTPHEVAHTTFVADINVAQQLPSEDDDSAIPTENVCVITLDAACTWLTILGCMQSAEYAYAEEPPAFRLDLIVHQRDRISSSTGGDLYQAIAFMLQSSTRLSVDTTQNEGSQVIGSKERIWASPRDAVVIGGSIYVTWISSLLAHGHALSALRNSEAQLDYCSYTCKQLIGLHRLEAGSAAMKSLTQPEQSILARRACAALLNWTYEYHRDARDEGSLARLKESWQVQEDGTCTIEGCPCLLWTGLDLADGRGVSRDDAARYGIDLLPWLEVHRWTIALHCRRRLVEGDYDGLVDAREEMLTVKAWIQPDELQGSFTQDLESFTIAASMGIRSLANHRGIEMSDEDDEAQVDILWNSLNLEKERVESSVEWRVHKHSIALEAATRVSSRMIVEADIVPVRLLASLLDQHR